MVVGGVQLGPLGTSATNWPIVPAPGDYEDGEFGGMMIGRGNRSTRRKPAPVPLCPPQIPHDLTRREPGQPRWEAGDQPPELWCYKMTFTFTYTLILLHCSLLIFTYVKYSDK
jgi:hypothetical protein